jgi:hypothetical protein
VGIRVIGVMLRTQSAFKNFSFSLFNLFLFFASRPPFGGIADGAGGFAQRGHAALFGNDGESCWIKPFFEMSALAKDYPTG